MWRRFPRERGRTRPPRLQPPVKAPALTADTANTRRAVFVVPDDNNDNRETNTTHLRDPKWVQIFSLIKQVLSAQFIPQNSISMRCDFLYRQPSSVVDLIGSYLHNQSNHYTDHWRGTQQNFQVESQMLPSSTGNKCQFWQIFVEALKEFPNYFIQSKTLETILQTNISCRLATFGVKTTGSVTSWRSDRSINWHLFPPLQVGVE